MEPTKQFEIEMDKGCLLGPRIKRSSKKSPEREVHPRFEVQRKKHPWNAWPEHSDWGEQQ